MAAATPAATASWPVPRWVVPFTRFWRNRSWARFSNCLIRVMVRYSPRAVASSIAPHCRLGRTQCLPGDAPGPDGPGRPLGGIGDEQLPGGEPGDDLHAAVHHHDLLLQPGGR